MQMYSMPVFDMIEAAFRAWGWTRRKIITRLLMRTLYVVFTCFVAVTLPFFGGNDLAVHMIALESTWDPHLSPLIIHFVRSLSVPDHPVGHE